MHIRVECTCGQAYAFDVEPVNERMPCPVACPACGADGTELANQSIRAAIGTTPTVQVPIPPPASAAPGLRVNRPPPPPAPPIGAPVGGTASPPPAPSIPAYARAYEPPKPPPEVKGAIPRGILGGVIAGSIAMTGWYFLTMATESEYGIAAWVVGVLTGLGVRIVARDGSQVLGYIAAVCAMLAILGGEFLVVNSIVNKVAGQMVQVQEAAYDGMVKEANEGVKLTTDEEIKGWLQTNDDSGEQITAQQVSEFRNVRQPKMHDLLNGKLSKAEFLKQTNALGWAVRFSIFKESLTLFSLLWVIFGVVSAWRIAAR